MEDNNNNMINQELLKAQQIIERILNGEENVSPDRMIAAYKILLNAEHYAREIEAVIDNDVSKLNEFIHMFFSEITEQNILPKEYIDEIKEMGIIYAGTLFLHGAMRIRSKWLQIN